MGGDGGDADIDGSEADRPDEDIVVHGHESLDLRSGKGLPEVLAGEAIKDALVTYGCLQGGIQKAGVLGSDGTQGDTRETEAFPAA